MNDETPFHTISPLIEAYSERCTSPEPELLKRLNRDTHLRTHMPQMLSGHLQGTFLRLISKMIKPERILEIGTFTGYSAICLAEGLTPNGVLHTIELSPELSEFASKYFIEAGLEDKIIMHTGDAIDIIPFLPQPFDLVFIDADKKQYIQYFQLIFDIISPGGWIIADNTLWYGQVLNPEAGNDKETSGIKAFNEFIQSHPGVENILLPFRDGLTIIRKK